MKTTANNTSQLKVFSHSQASHAGTMGEGKGDSFIIPLLFVFSVVLCLFVGVIYVYGIFSV